MLKKLLIKEAWHPFHLRVFTLYTINWVNTSKRTGCHAPLILIILAQANACLRASATLRLNGTVVTFMLADMEFMAWGCSLIC